MKFKILKTKFELEHFAKMTDKFIDVLLPLDYLKRSKVIGCFNKDRLCGGFVIVLKGPFRVVESIPGVFKYPKKFKEKETAEVTGLWLNSELVKGGYGAFFWIKLIKELIFSGKKNFVYAYSLKKSHIGRMYSPARPTVFFRGETTMLKGMNAPDKESVEIMVLRNLLLAPFINPGFFINRYMKGIRIKRRIRLSRSKMARSAQVVRSNASIGISVPVEDTVDCT